MSAALALLVVGSWSCCIGDWVGLMSAALLVESDGLCCMGDRERVHVSSP